MRRRNFIFNGVPVCVEHSGGTFHLKIGNGPWTMLQQCLDSTSLRQSFKDAVLNACNEMEEAARSGV